VEDLLDACPFTAPLASVDADGCSCDQRDSDGDGIRDCEDHCSATPPNQPVGDNGCPLPQEDDIPDIDQPVMAPVVEEDEVDPAEIDPPVEAAPTDDETDFSALATGGPSLCGSIAFIPIVFLMAGLVALRHRSARPRPYRVS
jgi:hypothetical protein